MAIVAHRYGVGHGKHIVDEVVAIEVAVCALRPDPREPLPVVRASRFIETPEIAPEHRVRGHGREEAVVRTARMIEHGTAEIQRPGAGHAAALIDLATEGLLVRARQVREPAL